MIKVTFKEPTKFWQHTFSNDVKDMQTCMFCFTLRPIEFIGNRVKLYFSDDDNDYQIFIYSKIQSIEHVKPTEL